MENNKIQIHRSALYRMLTSYVEAGGGFGRVPVFLFNVGLMPPPVCRLLQAVSRSTDVYHYKVSSRAGSEFSGRGEIVNPLLERFGEEQLEQVAILQKYAEENPPGVRVKQLQAGTTGRHNLGGIQESVINNTPFPVLDNRDTSIEVHSCHSPLREVEVLHNYLTGLFSDRGDVAPDDVLVVTPDLPSYAPFIESVFGTLEEGLPEIPYYLAGSTSQSGPGAVQAFTHLLKLPDSRFTKEELFEFLRHTAIGDRFHLSSSDVSQLEEWFDENRVMWGLDGQHRAEFQQPEENMHTWKYALKRGWMGQLAADRPGMFSDGMLLFSGITGGEQKELWARMQQILGELEKVKQDANTDISPGEWESRLNGWAERFLPRTSTYEKELQLIHNAVRQTIREMDLGDCRGRIPFSVVRTCLADKLNRRSSRSTFFTRGVIFNSMVPVRSLPFKVIALLGLNDDRFPRKPAHPEFDLMAARPLPGERDRKKEDRNLFLESVMAAGEVHYSSYIGRNQKDDEPVPPSPVLDEWIQQVARAHNQPPSAFVEEHSLNGFSIRAFNEESSRSFSRVYFNLAQRITTDGQLRGLESDRVLPPPDGQSEESITLDDLERFFKNPAGTFFKNRLGIYLRRKVKPGEEEFSLDGLRSYKLFRYLFGWTLQEESVERMQELLCQSGHLPLGWPGQQAFYDLLSVVKHTVEEIRERGHQPRLTSRYVEVQLPGVRIDGVVKSCSASGMLDVHPSAMSGKRVLASWIRHLVLCLQHPERDVSSDLLFGVKKGSGTWKRFGPEPGAERILLKLVDTYREGLLRPLNLYIDTAFEYAVHLDRGEIAAEKKARSAWGGEFNPWPERREPYLELLLGKDAEADTGAISEVSEKLYQPLVQNIQDP